MYDNSSYRNETEIETMGQAERTLIARLEYSRAKRHNQPLAIRKETNFVLPWFSYQLFGVQTGVHEGVILGPGDRDLPLEDLPTLADASGAAILKLTRIAPTSDTPPVPKSTPDVVRTRRWAIIRRTTPAREVLPLAPSYDEMLAGLGRHTRRNMRITRRQAAAERLTFDASSDAGFISPKTRATLARETEPEGMSLQLVLRLEDYADRTGQPFRSKIVAPDGAIVSYACGYFGSPGVAYLLFQLNDPAANRLSPSLLHRSFLIEHLVQLGYRELVFVHGCSGILVHACIGSPLEDLLLVRRSSAAYLTAAAIAALKPKTTLGRLARLTFSYPS